MSHDIFVSYSSQNKLAADAVVASLERNGVRCWVAPRDVGAGKSWAAEIISAIGGARAMVLVFSSDANRSENVGREVERALHRGIPVVPIRIQDVLPEGELEYFLSKSHWMDAISPPLESHLDDISQRIAGLISAQSVVIDGRSRSRAAKSKKVSKLLLVGLPMLVAICVAGGIFGSAMTEEPRRISDEYKTYYSLIVKDKARAYIHSQAPQRFSAWQAAAEKGNPDAEELAAICLTYGEGTAVNNEKAFGYAKLSADKGNVAAMNFVGSFYNGADDTVVKFDRALAISWFEKAAALGNVLSMFNLGLTYDNPDPINGNYAKARDWLEQAANLGYTPAMRSLASMALSGSGLPHADPVLARSWYTKAAALNDSYSQGYLIGDKLVAHLSIAANETTTVSLRESELAQATTAMFELKDLDIDGFTGVAENQSLTDIFQSSRGISKLSGITDISDQIAAAYVNAYEHGSRESRQASLFSFSIKVTELIDKWYLAGKYKQIATLWHEGFEDLKTTDYDSNNPDALISIMKSCICSLYKAGDRKEADQQFNDTQKFAEAVLKEDPWDYYSREAYSWMCFDVSAVRYELGDRQSIESLLSVAWKLELTKMGREDLLDKYPGRWPLIGDLPNNVDPDDVVVFDRVKPGYTGPTDITRFTVNIKYGDTTYPFFVFVPGGKNGYAEVQDQFRWLRERRGLEVPEETQSAFRKMNEVTAADRLAGKLTDFREECVEALAQKETTPQSPSPTPPEN